MLTPRTIEDLTRECPCHGEGWCVIRAIIEHTGLNDRIAEQWSLFYDYRFMEAKRIEREGGKLKGDEELHREFVERYAKTFAEVYHEGVTHKELFEAVFGIPYNNSDWHNGNGARPN